MLITLILPLIDVSTDHIFAIRNITKTSSPAVASIGFALLLNLIFGPMIYGLIFYSQFNHDLFETQDLYFQISNHFYLIVALYGSGISYDRSKTSNLRKSFFVLKKFFSVIFASFLFFIEEVQSAFIFYRKSKTLRLLSEKQKCYNHLSPEEKEKVKKFYNAKIRQLDKSQKLICREASVQVVLQLTLLIYQEILLIIPNYQALFIFYDLKFIISSCRMKTNCYFSVMQFSIMSQTVVTLALQRNLVKKIFSIFFTK